MARGSTGEPSGERRSWQGEKATLSARAVPEQPRPSAARPRAHPPSSPRRPGPPRRVSPGHGVGSGGPRPDPHPGAASCKGGRGGQGGAFPLRLWLGGPGVLDPQVVFGPGHPEGLSGRGAALGTSGPMRAGLSDPRPGTLAAGASDARSPSGRTADDYTSQDPPRPPGRAGGAPHTHDWCPNAPRLVPGARARGPRSSPHALPLPECHVPAHTAPGPGAPARLHLPG